MVSIPHAKQGWLSFWQQSADLGPRLSTRRLLLRLDGRHVVFGKVVEGLDIVKAIEGKGSSSGSTSGTITIADSGELEA